MNSPALSNMPVITDNTLEESRDLIDIIDPEIIDVIHAIVYNADYILPEIIKVKKLAIKEYYRYEEIKELARSVVMYILTLLHENIDEVDIFLLDYLLLLESLRFIEADKIWLYKEERDLPIFNETRWLEVVEKNEAIWLDKGMSKKFIWKIFDFRNEITLDLEKWVD